MKTFSVQKLSEQEPTVYGLALVPLGITTGCGVICILLAITTSSLLVTVGLVTLFVLTLVLSSYLYRIKILERLGDQQLPEKVQNDIL